MAQCTEFYGIDAMLKWTDGEMPMSFADKLVIDGYVLEVDVHFNGKTQLEIIATGMIDLDSGFIDAILLIRNTWA